MTQLLPWSYSRLDAFKKCRKMFYHQTVAKDVPFEESDQMKWGNRVHKALEYRVRDNVPLSGEFAQFECIAAGHFHTLAQLPRIITNGSLKGYDEYAYSNNFTYEVPQQALWITHPVRGITFSMPVQVEDKKVAVGAEWVSMRDRKA